MISPPSISAIFVTTRFMNSRSCEVMSSAPGSDFRKFSSQTIDSMSRWFVGSSRSRTSGLPSSTRAIATRIFQPPESAPTSPSICASSKPRPVQHVARLRLERVAAEVVVLLLDLAEALEDPVHVVGLVRDRPSRAAAPRVRGAASPTRPLPAMASSSTERPLISSTSWRK